LTFAGNRDGSDAGSLAGRCPDLILGIQEQPEPGRLQYFLWADGREARFGVALDRDVDLYFHRLRRYLDSISATVDADPGRVRRDLEGIGETLSHALLPEPLRSRLDARGVVEPDLRAPSLWILSTEAAIPWEILWIRARTENGAQGAFLAECFAVSHWPWNLPSTARLGLDPLALMETSSQGLPRSGTERSRLQEMAGEKGLRTITVHPVVEDIQDALRGEARAFHFIAHAGLDRENPDLSRIELDDVGGAFKVSDLRAGGIDLHRTRPWVFVDACDTGHGAPSLSGSGGLACGFVEAGAGAVLGTLWAIPGGTGADFAPDLYAALLTGKSAAEALRQVRLRLALSHPGKPTWLSYRLFAHPSARLDGPAELVPGWAEPVAGLDLPSFEWDPATSPPGALLRSDHNVVPFHMRERELAELGDWCGSDEPLLVRLYTGPGGMGKSRLAQEICSHMRLAGWRTGFVSSQADPQEAATRLVAKGGPLLAVLDYAERRRDLLVPILETFAEQSPEEGPFRLILLSRLREEWWDALRQHEGPVGSLIGGPRTTHHVLAPLADRLAEREETYRRAAAAFADRYDVAVPDALPEDLEAPYFRPVLMLHISALGRVEGVPLKGEHGILDWVLDREKRFWRRQMKAREIAADLLPGLGMAMCCVTAAGGVVSEGGAVRLLESLSFFQGQPRAVLVNVAHLLHQTYPGEHWIMPVLPDLLGDHLIDRELGDDPEKLEELANRVLGPP